MREHLRAGNRSDFAASSEVKIEIAQGRACKQLPSVVPNLFRPSGSREKRQSAAGRSRQPCRPVFPLSDAAAIARVMPLRAAAYVMVTMEPVVDIHTHILPDADDGARSWEMAKEMCAVAAHDGITQLVATPHANDEFA